MWKYTVKLTLIGETKEVMNLLPSMEAMCIVGKKFKVK